MSLAQISGENYLQLRSPVQFNGSVGAQIFSPYSDINLGVTNGFMTVTNLVEPSIAGLERRHVNAGARAGFTWTPRA